MAKQEDLVFSESNPYEKYRHVAFTLDEFLKMVKANKEHFINYCEIVVTDNGLIFLASPSHMDVAEWLRKKGFTNFILVWYNGFVSYDKENAMKLTASQMKVLSALLDHGLISCLIDSNWEWRK